MIANYNLEEMPKDKNFLIKQEVYMFNRALGLYECVGFKWIEAWYNHYKEEFEIFTGAENISTTELFHAVAWCELPIN